jgi:glycosidase
MDRSVLEGDPHSVIEAMAIAGYAIGSDQGYIYVRAEYPLAIQGVEQAIREGYFDRLDIRAIWLTPWQTQPAGSFPDQSGQYQVKGYHGYWPIKAREVDPRLGGAEALHSMVEEAHRHGIRIIMDAVVNHVHEEHEYYTDPDKAHWFRTDCVCGSPGCGWDEKQLSCLFTGYMPDINWNVKAAAAQFVADIL